MDLGVRGSGFLVFGGTAGIGLAAATTLAADGARLVLVGRNAERATRAAGELAQRFGTPVHALCGDVDEPDVAARITEQAAAELGGLQGMAITTGLGARGQRNLLGGSDEDWAATFEDVLMGTVRACRAVVPHLVETAPCSPHSSVLPSGRPRGRVASASPASKASFEHCASASQAAGAGGPPVSAATDAAELEDGAL